MLAQMNLLLHGLEAPQIAYGNTLERRINEIGHSERVDVILTNPPFGGEEEVGIKANFPPNMQTAETALLFLQYIMRKLRVAGAPVPGGKAPARGGRAAVVVPNGTLFGDGISAVIKEEMLKEFRLHTIVRLPQGRVRALHRHPGQPAVLRARRPDRHHLVLRAAPARRPQEVQQDRAAAVRGVRAGAGLVERPRGRPAGLEGGLRRQARCRRRGRHAALATSRGRAQCRHRPGQADPRTGAAISNAANGDKGRAARPQLRALKAEQQAHEQAAKAAQAEGDALYWPIYNLDLKNPMPRRGWSTPTRRT
jgi:type I restriction enzyme M protein